MSFCTNKSTFPVLQLLTTLVLDVSTSIDRKSIPRSLTQGSFDQYIYCHTLNITTLIMTGAGIDPNTYFSVVTQLFSRMQIQVNIVSYTR